MHIVLVSTPSRTQVPQQVLPMGIMWLASYLEEHGHKVTIVDSGQERLPLEETAEKIARAKPDLIGVGGIITAYSNIINLTEIIKRTLPDVPLVLGGQVVINNLQNCFEKMPIDYVISGYGEVPLLKLVRHLSGELDKDKIPGLTFRENDGLVSVPGREYLKNINDLPLPAYHLVDMEYYAHALGEDTSLKAYSDITKRGPSNTRGVHIMATLGCTDKCTFCIHEQEFVGLKRFSLDYVKKHIRLLYDKYNIRVLKIGEEMFITTLKQLKPFNKMMTEEFPDLYWATGTRANHVTLENVDELLKGNCYYINWGYESGSQYMLDLMQKRIDRQQNIDAFITLDNSNISVVPTLMVGNIGETNQSIKDTIASLQEAKIAVAATFYAQPYPGGRTWDWALERGIIPDTHEYLMAASDKDAGRLTLNLTSYPDWVLMAWNRQVVGALQRNSLPRLIKKLKSKSDNRITWGEIKRTANLTLRGCLPHKIPWFIHHAITSIYCGYTDIRKKIRPTEKDRQFEISVDARNALCPSQVLVARPQRFLDDMRLNAVLENGPVKVSKNDGDNAFIDGVHVKKITLEQAAEETSGE